MIPKRVTQDETLDDNDTFENDSSNERTIARQRRTAQHRYSTRKKKSSTSTDTLYFNIVSLMFPFKNKNKAGKTSKKEQQQQHQTSIALTTTAPNSGHNNKNQDESQKILHNIPSVSQIAPIPTNQSSSVLPILSLDGRDYLHANNTNNCNENSSAQTNQNHSLPVRDRPQS
ncbi:unnamed protein product [Didymodactylos carnosus]|uniref:Uncharacterized protein n=1 Tax=Didymodactylos carnosus TaxID=1234261 RepID=A0A813QB02_9BILA|nr:unnamed protein product [Didymodactylos carnosus]CAF3545527.1 unnamed protein product [Didymodactylos carnosus]